MAACCSQSKSKRFIRRDCCSSGSVVSQRSELTKCQYSLGTCPEPGAALAFSDSWGSSSTTNVTRSPPLPYTILSSLQTVNSNVVVHIFQTVSLTD